MRHGDGTCGRRQRRIRDRAALIERLLHRGFDRGDEASLVLERRRMRNRAQANRSAAPDNANGYALASQARGEVVGNGNCHPVKSRLLPDCGEQIEARCGAGDSGGQILAALRPRHGFQPASAPLKLLDDAFGGDRGRSVRGRHRNSNNPNSFSAGTDRYSDEETDRFDRTGIRANSSRRDDRAPFGIGSFGDPFDVAEIEIRRRPCDGDERLSRLRVPYRERRRGHA